MGLLSLRWAKATEGLTDSGSFKGDGRDRDIRIRIVLGSVLVAHNRRAVAVPVDARGCNVKGAHGGEGAAEGVPGGSN